MYVLSGIMSNIINYHWNWNSMLQNKLCVRLSLGAELPANICFGKYFGIKIYFVYLNFKVNKYNIFSDLAVLWGFISPFQLGWA